MSLIKRNITRISTLLASALLLAGFSALPAAAAPQFGTSTSVNPNGLSSFSFSALASSLDGSKLLAASGIGNLILSTDSGTTWSAVSSAGIHNWTTVAMNDSGTVMLAGDYGGSTYTSTNSGVTWASTTMGAGNWLAMDMNATGSVMAVTNGTQFVYVSTNYGANWTTRTTSGSTANKAIFVSAVGDKMVTYSSSLSSILISSDTGTTFTAPTTPGAGYSSYPTLWSSHDGQKIVYQKSTSSGQFYLSRDFATTWETITVPSGVFHLTFTATDDLTNMWAGTNGGSPYYSTNSGSTWSTEATSGTTFAMTINPGGTRWVIAFNSNTGIYTSDGPPTTQTYRPIYTGAANWSRASSSADGNVIAVTGINGEVTVSRDGGATWTGAASLGRNSTWTCLAVSGDGNTIFAGGYATRLYKSADKGVTWSPTGSDAYTSAAFNVNGCATNSDGSKVVALSSTNGVLLSTNSGSTFTQSLSNAGLVGGSAAWQSVTMTSDGSKVAVIPNNPNDTITVNTNGGASGSWTPTTYVLGRTGYDIKSSADGSVLIASINSTAPVISRDWGATWNTLPTVGSNVNFGISINSTGSFITIGSNLNTGHLYYSIDRGASFTLVPGEVGGNINAAAVSANGSKILYAVNGKQLQIMSLALTVKATFASLTFAASPAFRTPVSVTATLSLAGTDGFVTFLVNGKNVPGCVKIPTTSLIATCTWKPSIRGSVSLSAVSYPSDSSYSSSAISVPAAVGLRSGYR